ncbi:MAG TPA: hypothetical protein VJ772_06495 [Nitrososphaeraceae archaeon]|nr:hypothetical protein [Nitrososphaeraceae archaeon]
MKMKEVRIATITGDTAEQIEKALELTGIVIYKKAGERLIDVYTEAPK